MEAIAVPKVDPSLGDETAREFPQFREIDSPASIHWGSLSISKIGARSMLFASIRGKGDLSALDADLRSRGILVETNRIGREANSELANVRPAFCESVRLTGHYLSKSGHATSVEFMSVARSATEHDLVVEYIGRRFIMPTEAGTEFEKMLRRQYPELVKSDDLQTRVDCSHNPLCGVVLYGMGEPGKTETPTKWTAVEAALSVGRDYIVYFTPPILGYADLEFQLSPPSRGWEQGFRALWPQYAETIKVPDRFPNIALSQHPICKPPKPKIPSLE